MYLFTDYIGSKHLYDYTCKHKDYIVIEKNARIIMRQVISAIQ